MSDEPKDAAERLEHEQDHTRFFEVLDKLGILWLGPPPCCGQVVCSSVNQIHDKLRNE